MNFDEATRVMDRVPRDQIAVLNAALDRYKRYTVIHTIDELPTELAADTCHDA